MGKLTQLSLTLTFPKRNRAHVRPPSLPYFINFIGLYWPGGLMVSMLVSMVGFSWDLMSFVFDSWCMYVFWGSNPAFLQVFGYFYLYSFQAYASAHSRYWNVTYRTKLRNLSVESNINLELNIQVIVHGWGVVVSCVVATLVVVVHGWQVVIVKGTDIIIHGGGSLSAVCASHLGIQEVSDPGMLDIRSVTRVWQQPFLSFSMSQHQHSD